MPFIVYKALYAALTKCAAALWENRSLKKRLSAAIAGHELQSSIIVNLTRENEELRTKRAIKNMRNRDHEGRFAALKAVREESLATPPARSTAK